MRYAFDAPTAWSFEVSGISAVDGGDAEGVCRAAQSLVGHDGDPVIAHGVWGRVAGSSAVRR